MHHIKISSPSDYDQIPANENCKNCGNCCGPVMVDEVEKMEIDAFLKDHPEILTKARNQSDSFLDCMFRDDKEMKCMIYSVRPIICRLFGVTPQMHCKFGNSDRIKADFEIHGKPQLINTIWGKLKL